MRVAAAAILFVLSSAALAGEPTPAHASLTEHRAVSVGTPSFSKAGPDTVYLYGGPGSVLGTFQTGNGHVPYKQGWTGLDTTEDFALWRRSTYNMEHLANNGPGNHGMWAGRSASEEPGWTTPPGYGNNWHQVLEWSVQVSDPSAPQTVLLDFWFQYDTEVGYDYFTVQIDSAGFPYHVLNVSGKSGAGMPAVFSSPGLHFPDDFPGARSIEFAGNDYVGPNQDEIRLRMIASSDGAHSDEDGFWDTDGHSYVDDILVVTSEGSSFEDFEGPGPYAWQPMPGPYAGDFFNVFTGVAQFDDCWENLTGVAGFIDDGRGPFNPQYEGPGIGSTSNQCVECGYVVNYTGGVSGGVDPLTNYAVSPAIEWATGTAADADPQFAGALLRYDYYAYLPLINGIFSNWSVRSSSDGGSSWGDWEDAPFVYFSTDPEWRTNEIDVSNLLVANPTHVQARLSVLDLASVFAFPGTGATNAPLYDNVSLRRYRIGGPRIQMVDLHQFQDAFPQSGGFDVSNSTARDQLDVRLDMAQDVGTSFFSITPGDSIVAEITSIVPGVAISNPTTQLQLYYSLNRNPLFESAVRGNAPVTGVATGLHGWDQTEGSVFAELAATAAGAAIPDRYAFDLPDVDFFYPGDVLEYYIRAEDDAGNVTTLPQNLDGFDDPSVPFDDRFVVRALPSYSSTSGDHPVVLFWDDHGDGGVWSDALRMRGWVEGIDYDRFVSRAPESDEPTGLGTPGAHGANEDQIDGYATILYDSGEVGFRMLHYGGGGPPVPSNDVALLRSWFERAGRDRSIVHFGDHLASSTDNAGTSGLGYLTDVLGVEAGGIAWPPVYLDDQPTPRVVPTGIVPAFSTSYLAYGWCPDIHGFDIVDPIGAAVRSHDYLDDMGNPLPIPSAGVVHDRLVLGDRKLSMLFPYGFARVRNPEGGTSARQNLFDEILAYGGAPGPGIPVPVPVAQRLSLLGNVPNPFNPTTTLRFSLAAEGEGSVRVFDVRGALVRDLFEGVLPAGEQSIRWDGLDMQGRSVASGVYFVRYEFDGDRQEGKIALLK